MGIGTYFIGVASFSEEDLLVRSSRVVLVAVFFFFLFFAFTAADFSFLSSLDALQCCYVPLMFTKLLLASSTDSVRRLLNSSLSILPAFSCITSSSAGLSEAVYALYLSLNDFRTCRSSRSLSHLLLQLLLLLSRFKLLVQDLRLHQRRSLWKGWINESTSSVT